MNFYGGRTIEICARLLQLTKAFGVSAVLTVAGLGGMGAFDTPRAVPAPSAPAPRLAAPAPRLAAPPAVDAPAELGMTYLYVVGSEAAARGLWHAIYQAIELEPDEDARHVLVLDTPAAERDLFILQQEIEPAPNGNAADAGVRFVYLR
jgi:hypothetical protein